jgi:hypothetical protein
MDHAYAIYNPREIMIAHVQSIIPRKSWMRASSIISFGIMDHVYAIYNPWEIMDRTCAIYNPR